MDGLPSVSKTRYIAWETSSQIRLESNELASSVTARQVWNDRPAIRPWLWTRLTSSLVIRKEVCKVFDNREGCDKVPYWESTIGYLNIPRMKPDTTQLKFYS